MDISEEVFSRFSENEQIIMSSKKIYLEDVDPFFIMKTKALSLESLFEKVHPINIYKESLNFQILIGNKILKS